MQSLQSVAASNYSEDQTEGWGCIVPTIRLGNGEGVVVVIQELCSCCCCIFWCGSGIQWSRTEGKTAVWMYPSCCTGRYCSSTLTKTDEEKRPLWQYGYKSHKSLQSHKTSVGLEGTTSFDVTVMAARRVQWHWARPLFPIACGAAMPGRWN